MSKGYTWVQPTFDGKPLDVSLPPSDTWNVQLQPFDGYPDKEPIDPELAPWLNEFPDYNPTTIFTDNLAEGVASGKALPADVESVSAEQMQSYYPDLTLDQQGMVRNPLGRTNTRGGFLYSVGGNFSADLVLLWTEDKKLYTLVITKKLKHLRGKVLIPGGMCEAGENISLVLERELKEETAALQSFQEAIVLYAGIVVSSRNTDERWTETIAALNILDSDKGKRLKPKVLDQQEGIDGAFKFELTPESIVRIIPAHREFVNLGLAEFYKREPDWAERCEQLIKAA